MSGSGGGGGGGYEPAYPRPAAEAEAEMRAFISGFYRASDRAGAGADERWVAHFTGDARVTMGGDEGVGEQEIRELRARMWRRVRERRHSVVKVFPGRFGDGEAGECEAMLFGEVALKMREREEGGAREEGAREAEEETVVPWAAHAVLRREAGGWKFARYRVWLQR